MNVETVEWPVGPVGLATVVIPGDVGGSHFGGSLKLVVVGGPLHVDIISLAVDSLVEVVLSVAGEVSFAVDSRTEVDWLVRVVSWETIVVTFSRWVEDFSSEVDVGAATVLEAEIVGVEEVSFVDVVGGAVVGGAVSLEIFAETSVRMAVGVAVVVEIFAGISVRMAVGVDVVVEIFAGISCSCRDICRDIC